AGMGVVRVVAVEVDDLVDLEPAWPVASSGVHLEPAWTGQDVGVLRLDVARRDLVDPILSAAGGPPEPERLVVDGEVGDGAPDEPESGRSGVRTLDHARQTMVTSEWLGRFIGPAVRLEVRLRDVLREEVDAGVNGPLPDVGAAARQLVGSDRFRERL